VNFSKIPGMETVVAERLAAVDMKLAELSARLDTPKKWRNAVGMLSDTKVSPEADELGRQFRTNEGCMRWKIPLGPHPLG